MPADDSSRMLLERRKALQRQRREQRLRRALALTVWALSVGSVSGLLSIYHMLASARTEHGTTRSYPAAGAPRATDGRSQGLETAAVRKGNEISQTRKISQAQRTS
ncbi:MAG: hypothetical protein K6T83_20570, partial [Alicyclobacillus sp.]|nr:hypothetical protein [Alicyclobacillus sp.]